MSVTAIRRWLLPAVLGIIIGAIVGSLRAFSSLSTSDYLHHHMYSTFLRVLLGSVNSYSFMMCALFYPLYMGIRFKGWLRLPCFLLAFAAFVRILQVSFNWAACYYNVFRGLSPYAYIKELSIGAPQIIALVCCIVLGFLLIRRLRRVNDAQPDQIPPQNQTVSKTTAARPLYHGNALAILVLAVFLGLNLTWAFFRVVNAYEVSKAPNVIYIMVDTLRADHLGCYGYFRKTSPNVDEFARQGLRFDRAISQAPWTTASVISFMSSRYLRTTLDTPQSFAPTNVTLMPELLQDRGYTTAAVISNPMAGKEKHLDRGYDYYYELKYPRVPGYDFKASIPSSVESKALEMLESVKNRRFFMFVHFMGPHSPYAAHREYNFYPGYKGKLSRQGVTVGSKTLAGDDLKYAIALYDGEIAFTDRYIGMFLEELKRQRMYDNTLIVLMADHGEELEEHGEMTHGTHLYDDTVRVPLIVKLPGQKTGGVVQGDFSLINLLPSITNSIHLDASALGFQGTAIPLGGLRKVREMDIYSSTDFLAAKLESLRSKTNKLIVDKRYDKVELYNLAKDPREAQNAAGSMPGLASSFRSELQRVDKQIDSALGSVAHFNVTPEEERESQKTLRSLGYMQ